MDLYLQKIFDDWLNMIDEVVREFKSNDDTWDKENFRKLTMEITYPNFLEISRKKNENLFQKMRLSSEKRQIILDKLFVDWLWEPSNISMHVSTILGQPCNESPIQA